MTNTATTKTKPATKTAAKPAAKKPTTKVVARPEAKATTKAPVTKKPAAKAPVAPVVEAPAEVAPVAVVAKAAATFTPADQMDTHVCRTCTQELPVRRFPTVDGPNVRSTRCRSCRDAAKAAA
jgi:hypothetical protein